MFGETSRYWLYLIKSVLGVWLIWIMLPLVTEMRWKFSWEAVVVGVGVCVIWVGLDPFIPKNHIFFTPTPDDTWNPFVQYGDGAPMAWLFVVVRILGSTFVVPPLEETFYRSFLYRYLVKAEFQTVALSCFAPMPFIVTSVLFGMWHYEWLAGILCGALYQWLVLHKGRLGDAMTAHAITNFLLGGWVVWKGAWGFW